ncbi:MAG: protein kinase [Planctomycetota bacterium]|nr:protein kinase [Planctomycetota bacterium]
MQSFRTVALRRTSHGISRRAKWNYRREVQAAAQVAHPSIVTAYYAEQEGNVHFLAMEFVDGTDLTAVVSRREQLPVNESCDYIRHAAFGLQHAHEQGMVRRDIKPHNLMLSPEGQVRIRNRVSDHRSGPGGRQRGRHDSAAFHNIRQCDGHAGLYRSGAGPRRALGGYPVVYT